MTAVSCEATRRPLLPTGRERPGAVGRRPQQAAGKRLLEALAAATPIVERSLQRHKERYVLVFHHPHDKRRGPGVARISTDRVDVGRTFVEARRRCES